MVKNHLCLGQFSNVLVETRNVNIVMPVVSVLEKTNPMIVVLFKDNCISLCKDLSLITC